MFSPAPFPLCASFFSRSLSPEFRIEENLKFKHGGISPVFLHVGKTAERQKKRTFGGAICTSLSRMISSAVLPHQEASLLQGLPRGFPSFHFGNRQTKHGQSSRKKEQAEGNPAYEEHFRNRPQGDLTCSHFHRLQHSLVLIGILIIFPELKLGCN